MPLDGRLLTVDSRHSADWRAIASAFQLALTRVLRPLAVSLAYYLGARIGFAFQSPATPQSVLWLPNSILLATLLLAPIWEWLWYLAAAFPAHILAGWQTSAPALPMALLFLTNCSDAALGAYLVRRFARQPFRFHNLHSTAIFVVFGATLSPVLLSFADAAISVATGWAPAYWTAFSTRVHSNVLTHLMVVPALVKTLRLDVRSITRSQVQETIIFAVGLLTISLLAFAEPSGWGAWTALSYLPLPLLFWAAVRFGPGGTGWSVLLVAFVASWNALHGRGPFTTGEPAADVKALQLFLLSISAPLLFLSATIRERDLTTVALQESESTLRQSLARVNDLTGKMIAAQELERMRIARDLHDDVSQRLAALSIGLSSLRNRPGVRPAEGEAVASLQSQAAALVESIRDLSHGLHIGALDRAGLISTVREHCEEFGRQHQIDVAFAVRGDVDAVPHEVAVALYRIVQEGLRNVFRHACAAHASVTLARSPAGVQLIIEDRGLGFDVDAARRAGGLGLLSIEERTKLIGGSVTIGTKLGRGTSLQIDVPLSAHDPVGADVPAPSSMGPDVAAGSRLPRVLLADDHKIVLDGLRHLLRDSCEIVGAVGDGPSLVAGAAELHPDIIVADISMPGYGGLEAIKRLKARGVASKFIVLTMHMDRDVVSAMMAMGVAGYVPKHEAGEELVAAIRQVFDGLTYFKPTPSSRPTPPATTPRL